MDRDEAAEKCWETFKELNAPKGQVSYYYRDNREYFIAGYKNCIKHLTEQSDEFDKSNAESYLKARFPHDLFINSDAYQIVGIESARWQHAQDQLQIQALREELKLENAAWSEGFERDQNLIKALKAEIERLKG